MSINLYEETIDEGHRKIVKDTKDVEEHKIATNDMNYTVNNNEWTNDNIGWRRLADEGQRMKTSG
jgi:hypothetical protein